MKVTRSWLENYIEITNTTDELCHDLTMAGLEVDDISKIENDYLIDIDLTPNRSDCLSARGISRELNSINPQYKKKSKVDSNDPNPTCKNTGLKFNILESNVCPRYGYMYLENVSSECSAPEYVNKRLNDIGITLIHPIVDILNYIMIDIGQPMHAYDADKINGEITIRMAKDKEIIPALDGNKYKLNSENIVVSDSAQIMSLAGIIGSEEISVSGNTKNILVESAFFTPNAMANKARLLKLQTESSHRFERGVDYNLPREALAYLSQIIEENKICDFSNINLIDQEHCLPQEKKVKINQDNIRKSIGIDISDEAIINILLSAGCKFDKKSNTVLNPSYRYDLAIHADYVEEVARLYGYDNIPVTSERINIEPSKKYIPFKIINKIRQYFYNNSYSECINYSFVNDDSLENLNWKSEDFKNHNKISNYMSLEQNKLRSNLVSSLIRNIEYNNNMSSEHSYRFFEISTVFGDNGEQVLTCVVNGDKHEEQWSSKSPKFDKYDMTTIVEDISKLFGLNKSDLTYVIKDVKSNGKKYIYMTLSVDSLISKITENSKEQHVNYTKLPYIRRDLSFVIDESIEYKNILKIIEKTNVHSLKKTLLFDLYIGKNIPAKMKSLGIGFIFQDEEKTLTHEEADGFIEKILGQLKEQFKIELRK